MRVYTLELHGLESLGNGKFPVVHPYSLRHLGFKTFGKSPLNNSLVVGIDVVENRDDRLNNTFGGGFDVGFKPMLVFHTKKAQPPNKLGDCAFSQ